MRTLILIDETPPEFNNEVECPTCNGTGRVQVEKTKTSITFQDCPRCNDGILEFDKITAYGGMGFRLSPILKDYDDT